MSCPSCQPSPTATMAPMPEGHQPTIVLVGNPNVGKSTLFNHVTGARQRVINAPGTTVHVASGYWSSIKARVLDLPGTYSLVATSPDEQVVTDTISCIPGSMTDPDAGFGIDLVLMVMDGASMTRSLYLLAQIAQTGQPVAALVTMCDVAEANGEPVNVSALSAATGIPVMAFDPRSSKDYVVLDEMVLSALQTRPRVADMEPDPQAPGYSATAAAEATQRLHCSQSARHVDNRDILAQAAATERDAEKCAANQVQSLGTPTVRGAVSLPDPTDAIPGAPTSSAASLTADASSPTSPSGAEVVDPADGTVHAESEMQRATVLFSWVDDIETAVRQHRADASRLSRSDKIDRVLLNPIAGTVIFFALLWLLFKIAGEWVGPIQDWFDAIFSSTDEGAFSVANGALWVLNAIGVSGTWIESLLVNGVIAGMGVVASFFPLMFVIYAAFALLEDSGYMARVAFLGDRLMRRIGLDGRVILPLIMGFGCNVPSLAAARTLPSARQRLVTVIITPFTSCAARLTIYLMIAKIFFAEHAGTVVWVMYLLSLVLIVTGAWVLKFFITKEDAAAPLMLVLPAYQMPRPLVMLTTTWQRAWAFVTGAGKIIVVMTVVVWLMGAIPMGAGAAGKGFADPELSMENSLYGKTAQALVPIFKPTGFGEWHMTGALMTGFVAKETVVSSIVTSYNMDPEVDGGDAEEGGDDLGKLPQLLQDSLNQSAGDGYEPLAAFAFLVFVLAYTPCLATVAEQAKLIGAKKTLLALVAQLAVAWVLAVAIFQVGRLFV